MPSLTNLRTRVRMLALESIPAFKEDSEPCTVGELKNVVSNFAELLDQILEELEGIE